MTEEEARNWVAVHFGQEALAVLSLFVGELLTETAQQNLIASSTIDSVWARHVADSAQLVGMAPRQGHWIDIGTGAGFPGLIVAVLRRERITLVEPRRRRADFLRHCASLLSLDHVAVCQQKVETLAMTARIISARAVAPVEKLLHAAAACGSRETRWLLPRGHVAGDDMDRLRKDWGGMFHMKQSLTDPASSILICDGPHPR